MNVLNKIMQLLIDYGIQKNIPDDIYLKKIFKKKLGTDLDLDNPTTFNEKLQWLKLYERKDIYTEMVDKYEVKKIIEKKIGKEYVIPILGVWDKFKDIDFEKLPDKFVLKCTHDSGGLLICKDKRKMNYRKAQIKFDMIMKRNFYYRGREWPYKNVKPRIIAEKYLEDDKLKELRDYKFFCFNGVPKIMKVDFDRFINHRANYYDLNGNLLEFGEADYLPDYNKKINMPKNMEKMIKFAKILSNDTKFLRVDFYEINGKMYFGELTFFPASGFGKLTDKQWDKKLGSWINLK